MTITYQTDSFHCKNPMINLRKNINSALKNYLNSPNLVLFLFHYYFFYPLFSLTNIRKKKKQIQSKRASRRVDSSSHSRSCQLATTCHFSIIIYDMALSPPSCTNCPSSSSFRFVSGRNEHQFYHKIFFYNFFLPFLSFFVHSYISIKFFFHLKSFVFCLFFDVDTHLLLILIIFLFSST